jgi:hypothetical protein
MSDAPFNCPTLRDPPRVFFTDPSSIWTVLNNLSALLTRADLLLAATGVLILFTAGVNFFLGAIFFSIRRNTTSDIFLYSNSQSLALPVGRQMLQIFLTME